MLTMQMYLKCFCFSFQGEIEQILNPNKGDVRKALPEAGGGSASPPHLSWLWSQFLLKNHVSLKTGINSNSFDPFSEFFSQKLPKKWQKLKIYQKIAKNERKFQIW